MKATLLLKKEHDSLRQMVDRIRKPQRGDDKASQVERIQTDIQVHWRIERELFYPEIENTPSTQAGELIGSALHQQEEIERLFNEIPERSSKKFDSYVSDVAEKVSQYLDFEEDRIFEEARQHLSEFRMEQLGLEMEDRRRFLISTAA
jgi:hypothetical protein